MKNANDYFELISSAADLDDPAETALAQKFMIDALYRVTADLPPQARDAAVLANRFSTGVATAAELERERVRLWDSISGRVMSQDADVQRTRAAIHVLYPPASLEMQVTLASFLDFWFGGGLSESKLAAALFNDYGLTINSSGSPSAAAEYAHVGTMKKFVIDCSTVTREMELWEKYVEVTEPEGVEFFGYGLDSFNDAITGGGPGFPGECEIYFTNTARIQRFRDGAFYKSLERIANESTSARIFLEPRIVPSTKPWWKFW